MRRGLIITGVILVLMVSVFQWVLAETRKSETLQERLAKYPLKNELTHLRTENRRTFKEKDGKLITFIATEPLNYRDDNNRFEPIEINLKSDNSGKSSPATGQRGIKDRFRHHALKNSIKARFAEESNGGLMLEYQKQSIELLFNHPHKRRAKISKNKIQYPKIFDNCDLEYTILPGRVKDELIFRSAPKTPVLSFKVSLNGLKTQNGPGGSINLADASGKVVFTILPSIMFEKENEERCKVIETKFHREGAQLYCDLVLDMGWLKDKKRKYPVVVDPQVTIQDLYSYGQTNQRFLLYTPETHGTVKCEIKIDGPDKHGHLSKHDEARGHFKDLTANKIFLNYNGLSDYHQNHEEAAIAGHYYEVEVYGGRTKHKIGSGTYYGEAWATITYGDTDGYLFEKVPSKVLFAKVHQNIVEKAIEVKYPQTISYTSNSNTSSSFQVFQVGDEVPIFTPVSNNGTLQLNTGSYKIVVSQNAWAEFYFPRLTANYESQILMRSNPGVIDSTFILPTSSEVKMQFKTAKNGTPGSFGYPSVKIKSGMGTVYERTFDVNYYNYFDGGDKVTLAKEVPYHLIISRGESMQSGWGSVELEVYHPENRPCVVTDLRLIDNQNTPALNGYANGEHKLCFDYTDPDDNPLKEYKFTIEQTNSAKKYEYWLNPMDASSGIINIPYLIRQFKFDSGGEILCRVDAWDGFDIFEMSKDYHFTLDLTPPVVDQFSGEVLKTDNSLHLECQTRDLHSGLKSNKISWKVNGQSGGSRELSQSEPVMTIPNLPPNARVEVTLDVVDNIDNKTTRSQIFYTYPETATLLAPVQAVSQKKADLKISKAAASYIRVERYRKDVGGNLSLDYDTGYLDPSKIGQSIVGNPQVSMTAPANGSSFSQPAEIFLSADAFDIDGSIIKVLFYAGSKYIGTATRSPYHCTWSNVPAGNYSITARAIDDDGLETVSSPINITVKNSPPTVVITYPKQSQTFTWPGSVTINADAFDSDGGVVKVDFYYGNTLIGSDTASPYSINWNNIPIGSYTLTAKATDNNGAVSSSTPITITVSPPPLQPYSLFFNCHNENSGVKNTYTLYLPANWPAPGSYTYGPLGEGGSVSINNGSNVSTIPCKIRVHYVLTIEDKSDKHHNEPYFNVTLNNGQQVAYQSFHNATRSGDFEIPASSYVRIDYYSGHHENEHTIKDDDDYGYNCWCTLTFEYVLNMTSVALTPSTVTPLNGLETINATEIMADTTFESETTQELVYSLPEPEPARKHETYVYRIYTKNGDKEVWRDSQPVPVLNNPPEILAMEPVPGLTTYSYQTLKFKIHEVTDQDDDSLAYTYRITGKKSTGEDYTYGPENRFDQDPVTITNLPDGTYTWTVEVKDQYQGTTTASGNLIVDKEQPVASFNINGGSRFTNNPAVQVKVDETYNVYRIRFSFDNIHWIDPVTGWNDPIDLTVPSGDGEKTIYMQAQTEAQASANVWGPPVSMQRSIFLDTVSPEITHFTVFNQGGTGSVYFRWGGGNDDLSGIAGYKVQHWNGMTWIDLQADDNRITVPATGYNTPVVIQVQLLDKAGNQSEWVGATGYTRAAPGSLNLAETTSGYTPEDGHYINLKFNPAEGATGYKLICAENSGGGDIAKVDATTLSYQDNGLVPHGVYKYKIQTFNSSGEITETELEPVQVANIPPEKPAGLGPKGYIAKIQGITLDFDRPLNNLDADGDPLEVKYFLSTDNISYTEQPNEILNDLADGRTYFWKAGLSDGYGGLVETDPVSFTVDVTPPVITVDNITFDWALEHRVRIEATDNGSGIASVLVNGVPGNSSQEILINKQGANLLTVTVTDQAGNTASFSHTYYVDQTPPVTGNVRFDLPQSDGKYLAGDNLVPVVWEGSDPETGIKQFKYAWSDSSGSYDPGKMQTVVLMDRQGTYQHNFLGSFEDGRIYYLYIQPENRLGLQGATVQSVPLLYDHSGPLLKINELTGGLDLNGYYYLSKLANVNLNIDAGDQHSGVSKLEYALTETTSPETVQWFNSLNELKTGTSPAGGKIYYLAVRATNGAGLISTVYSEPLIIDGSAPVLTVTAGSEQKDNRIYLAQVATHDPETMVVKLEYAIGSAPGATDLSQGLPGADSNGWIAFDYPADRIELRQYADIPVGTIYFFTVKAANITGEVATATTAGTKVIAGDAPVVRDDGGYTSEQEALHFEWTYPDSPGVIQSYEYRIRCGESLVKDWTETGETTLVITGLQLQHNLTYYCEVRAIFVDGSISPAGTSDGILIDFTPPDIRGFEYPNYSTGNGIDLAWAANDSESGVKCYAGIGTSPGESGVTKGWLALGNLKQFRICQDTAGNGIEFAHGQKYYLTLLAENGAGRTVQKISTGITIDRTVPQPPIVIDEGNYTNRNDQLKFSWKWPLGDPESGIREYWCALTTERAINGGEDWYSNEQYTEAIIDDVELFQGGTYYLAVKAINNAGGESIGFSDGILIDTTAPTPPTVVDHGDFSLNNNSLEVSMVASDAESGVSQYRLSLGTRENPEGILANQTVMSSGGAEQLNLTGLNLEEGQVYFFTISAINQAGIISMSSTSDGIMVDTKLPELERVTVQERYLTDPTRLSFDWQVKSCTSGIIDAQYAISEDPNGSGLSWQPANLSGDQTVTGLNLVEGRTYYTYVRVQNRALADNTPSVWSAPGRSNPIAVDTTPPEIVKIITPQLAGKHFPLQWEARDAVSGITEYRYAVGSYRGGTDISGGWVSMVTNQTSVSFHRDDLPLHNSHFYYISVTARNGAGLWSEAAKSGAIITELTPATISKLEYPSSYLRSRTSIQGISWEGRDDESGIAGYRVKLVTVKDGQALDTASVLTGKTQGTIDLNQLNLEEAKIYYIAFQLLNGAGDWSNVVYSHAITVDTIAPIIPEPSLELVTNSGQMPVEWQSTESGTAVLKLICPNGREEVETVAMEIQNIHNFNQSLEGNYKLIITPIDLAGNTGIPVMQTIRLNAKPIVNPGPERKVFKGGTVIFEPEVSDSDGTVVEYLWDFGNGETSVEAKPGCSYRTLGEYTVTLKVKDNDGKWSEPGITHVTVTNTASGELVTDEEWEGEASISGDIIVPQGVTLRIKPGTQMDFTGKYKVIVYGRIFIEGTAQSPVVIGANTTTWDGIRLINAEPGSAIRYAEIYLATSGLVISESDLAIENCLFKGNRIGLHILKSAPAVNNCIFEENLIYGVKEDDNATPTVSNCKFINNLVVDYYEDKSGIIDMKKLNGFGDNTGNTSSR